MEGQNSDIGVKNIPELMTDNNSQIQKSQWKTNKRWIKEKLYLEIFYEITEL